MISPNGGSDVHGSLDALPTSQQTDGNGHWETLEVYLLVKIFRIISVICFLYKNIIGHSGNIWSRHIHSSCNFEIGEIGNTGKSCLYSNLWGNILPASYVNSNRLNMDSIWEFGRCEIAITKNEEGRVFIFFLFLFLLKQK